jgi:DNA-binding transcriptional regulator YhcF (GntR family)
VSYKIVDEIIVQTLFESPDKWVLASLARHAKDEDRIAWPSVKTMAQQAGVSERTVQRALREYEKIGVISDVTQYSEDLTGKRKRSTKYGGTRRSCCYQINDLGSKEITDKLIENWRKREAAREKRSKKRRKKTPSR